MCGMYTCSVTDNLFETCLNMRIVHYFSCCPASFVLFLFYLSKYKCHILPHSTYYPPTDAFGEQGRAAKNQFSAVPPNSAVNMDVELVSLKPVVDVSGDLKVMKKTLKSGDGLRTPHDGETVHSKNSFAF